MQFFILSRRKEGFTDDEYVAHAAEEAQQAQVLYEDGFIRQIWHRTDTPGACIVVEASSEEFVREKLNTLPFVKVGMIEISIVPLRPYRGFCLATTSSGEEDLDAVRPERRPLRLRR